MSGGGECEYCGFVDHRPKSTASTRALAAEVKVLRGVIESLGVKKKDNKKTIVENAQLKKDNELNEAIIKSLEQKNKTLTNQLASEKKQVSSCESAIKKLEGRNAVGRSLIMSMKSDNVQQNDEIDDLTRLNNQQTIGLMVLLERNKELRIKE